LKPENIFIVGEIVKIGDFGLAIQTEKNEYHDLTNTVGNKQYNHTTGLGTLMYSAPEQLNGDGNYFSSVDIYALGIISVEMFYMNSYKTRNDRMSLLSSIRNGVFSQDLEKKYPTYMALAKTMIQHDPNARPTSKQILYNPLFADYVEYPKLNNSGEGDSLFPPTPKLLKKQLSGLSVTENNEISDLKRSISNLEEQLEQKYKELETLKNRNK